MDAVDEEEESVELDEKNGIRRNWKWIMQNAMDDLWIGSRGELRGDDVRVLSFVLGIRAGA